MKNKVKIIKTTTTKSPFLYDCLEIIFYVKYIISEIHKIFNNYKKDCA